SRSPAELSLLFISGINRASEVYSTGLNKATRRPKSTKAHVILAISQRLALKAPANSARFTALSPLGFSSSIGIKRYSLADSSFGSSDSLSDPVLLCSSSLLSFFSLDYNSISFTATNDTDFYGV